MTLTTTLAMAAAAAILNGWLMIRVGQKRTSEGISVGNGGNEMVTRRMRAHSNFIESAPLVLILIGAIEMSGQGGNWLAVIGAVYILARVAHAFGMDGGSLSKGRFVGTIVTLLTLIGLAIAAALIASGYWQ